MRTMTKAVLKAGIITPNMLREMKRFSPTLEQDAEVEEPKELELAAKIIADALESEGYSLVKETDLDVLRQYMEKNTTGSLHLEAVAGEPTDVNVTYAMSKTGEFIIAWNSDSIADELVMGTTFLETVMGIIMFKDVRELWYGDKKAFMVCIPRD